MRETNFSPHAIQKPFFSAPSSFLQFLKAGAMGMVLAVSFFWQCEARPAIGTPAISVRFQ
jgi:hypothetical protein